MAYPLQNSNSGGRTQTVRRKFDAKHSPNMYCRIPQKNVGQKHVEQFLKTFHFGYISGQSYRSVQSKENANRWAENQTWPWPRPSGNHKLRPFVRNAADNAYRSSEIQHRERENGDRSPEMHRRSAWAAIRCLRCDGYERPEEMKFMILRSCRVLLSKPTRTLDSIIDRRAIAGEC